MKQSLFLIFISITLFARGQNVEVVSNVINFADATEISSTSAEVIILNPGIYPVDVSDIDLFELYSSQPFSVADTAFTLMPQDSHKVVVNFLPRHNIQHSMGLVIKTTSGFGHVAVELEGQGKYSDSYYSTTENKSEEALKTALKTRIGLGYNSLGYTTARDNMYGSIDNDSGVVECVYTGRTATFNTRAGANANSFNTEHTYPQGMFNQNEPMRSDLHHLFPTDVAANSQRGNDPFGIVTNSVWSQGGSASGGGKFEPRDVQKGATARAMMYFVLRYQDYNNFFQSQANVLYTWHEQFPPGAKEKSRNSEIAALQNSRNPFVDYPQFKERITSLVGNGTAPAVKELYLSDDTIDLAWRAGRYVYDFVLYNSGNTDITLTNFSLSDTSLHFDQGAPGQLIIGPHQSATLPISFNSAKNYAGNFLQFDTDIQGQSSILVPIESGTEIGMPEHNTVRWEIYPNPVEDHITIKGSKESIERVWLNSMSGAREELTYKPGERLYMGDKAPGLYLLTIQTREGITLSKKVVIK